MYARAGGLDSCAVKAPCGRGVGLHPFFFVVR